MLDSVTVREGKGDGGVYTYVPILREVAGMRRKPGQSGAAVTEQAEVDFGPDVEGEDVC